MNRIEITKRAHKQLNRIPARDASRIENAIDSLERWPDCRNTKSLVNREGYRLRVGRYRVIFTVHNGIATVIRVEEVKKRDERTY